jgi:hypothetical protein
MERVIMSTNSFTEVQLELRSMISRPKFMDTEIVCSNGSIRQNYAVTCLLFPCLSSCSEISAANDDDVIVIMPDKTVDEIEKSITDLCNQTMDAVSSGVVQKCDGELEFLKEELLDPWEEENIIKYEQEDSDNTNTGEVTLSKVQASVKRKENGSLVRRKAGLKLVQKNGDCSENYGPEKFPHNCSNCPFRTISKQEMTKHLRTHTGEKPFQCSMCAKTFSQKNNMLSHEKIHTGEKPFHCDQCDSKFYKKDHLILHARTHSEHVPDELLEMDDVIDTVSEVDVKQDLGKIGNENHTKISLKKAFVLQCDQCDFKTNNCRKLNEHRKNEHMVGLYYHCDQCDYKTRKKYNLKLHVNNIHNNSVRFVCDQCDYQCKTNGRLRAHIGAKHEGIRYSCNLCEFKALTTSHLNYHKQSKHEKNLYLCDQCEFKTHAKCNLKQHVKEQHLKITFSCTQCSYQSTRKEYLRQHVRRDHEGLYYYCDQCNFKTSRNSQLTKHIKCKHDS